MDAEARDRPLMTILRAVLYLLTHQRPPARHWYAELLRGVARG